jgi:hypothetical protein
MFRRGYAFGSVTRLRRQKSPYGCQLLSSFCTKWRGEEQGLSDGRVIPSLSNCLNFFLAASSFSLSKCEIWRRWADQTFDVVKNVRVWKRWWSLSWIDNIVKIKQKILQPP